MKSNDRDDTDPAPIKRRLINVRAFVHLCHQSVGSGALLILEDDVRVVVGHKVPEPGVVPGHAALADPAGRQRVLANVRHMLLEHQRRELPETRASSATPAGPASQHQASTVVQHR